MYYRSYVFFLLIVFLGSCSKEQETSLTKEIEAIENGLIKNLVVKGEPVEKMNLLERMAYFKVPGVSVAVVRDGKLRWARGYGLANTVDSTRVNTNTLFQAGSISKPVAALAVLRLMEEGKVELDNDVREYLVDWKLPDYSFEGKVTIRGLLTHTAGISIHGFPGYRQQDYFPTIHEVLDGKGNTGRIYVSTPPDSVWRYSGGGYTIMENIVEEISGMPLEDYMDQFVLGPLQMANSTYSQPLPETLHQNASAAYYGSGEIIEGLWHNYPEQAAAELWTTPTDLAKYCIEIQQILADEKDGLLSKETVGKMLTKHKNNWGLGPSLVWEGDSLRFQHGGKNAGFTNNMIAFAHRGEAYIVMTNADNGGPLIREILRSISAYYDLNFSKPRVVSLASPGTYNLDSLVGKYNYVEEDYFVEASREGEILVLNDPNDGERNELRAMDATHFIDLDDGDELVFDQSNDRIEFIWNGRFRFYKIEE